MKGARILKKSKKYTSEKCSLNRIVYQELLLERQGKLPNKDNKVHTNHIEGAIQTNLFNLILTY
ncbi:hypothetical protein WN51_11222 [Melipona quadrifasciata]|uniref:Uncharacterized protein n=1 Tax=Melipona quadrifasciata TaxID=166423 RepID=A0A0M9A621_9HYME|nr:hypothetical protein WN51_11222 [Melipona quadrifasciata]